jgi:hypothetical protein
VKILGDGTQEFTTALTNRLPNELGITTVSFTLVETVVGGGVAGVVTRTTPIEEEKTVCMLLLILLIFLRMYCNHNRNT